MNETKPFGEDAVRFGKNIEATEFKNKEDKMKVLAKKIKTLELEFYDPANPKGIIQINKRNEEAEKKLDEFIKSTKEFEKINEKLEKKIRERDESWEKERRERDESWEKEIRERDESWKKERKEIDESWEKERKEIRKTIEEVEKEIHKPKKKLMEEKRQAKTNTNKDDLSNNPNCIIEKSKNSDKIFYIVCIKAKNAALIIFKFFEDIFIYIYQIFRNIKNVKVIKDYFF